MILQHARRKAYGRMIHADQPLMIPGTFHSSVSGPATLAGHSRASGSIQGSRRALKTQMGARWLADVSNSPFVRNAISVRLRALILRVTLRMWTLTVHSPMPRL